MGISITMRDFLVNHSVSYDLVEHPYTRSSLESAETAHIPGDQLAKCVVLEDDQGYLMAIVPSTHKVDLNLLGRYLNRNLELATEAELEDLFDDCDVGAIPPFGQAFGYEMILDDSLLDCEDIYFEAGDHTDLIHISGTEFSQLMEDVDQTQFSYHI